MEKYTWKSTPEKYTQKSTHGKVHMEKYTQKSTHGKVHMEKYTWKSTPGKYTQKSTHGKVHIEKYTQKSTHKKYNSDTKDKFLKSGLKETEVNEFMLIALGMGIASFIAIGLIVYCRRYRQVSNEFGTNKISN